MCPPWNELGDLASLQVFYDSSLQYLLLDLGSHMETLDRSKEALHIEGMSDNDAEDSTDELSHGLIGDC